MVIGLGVMGFGNGAWDVAMNVEAAAIEQHLGRSIMSRFHAGFSVGTVIGALAGAAMNALAVSVTAHLLVVALLMAITMPLATRGFLPAGTGEHEERFGVATHAGRHVVDLVEPGKTVGITLVAFECGQPLQQTIDEPLIPAAQVDEHVGDDAP